MNRWGFFSVGILSGVVVVLLSALLMQNREPLAHATPAPLPQATDNDGHGLIVTTGASMPNQNDILWVVSKRPATRKAGGDPKDIVAQKDERISLAAYKIENNARSIRLVAARDISFDLDLLSYKNEAPTVKEIVDELRKSQPKDEKK